MIAAIVPAKALGRAKGRLAEVLSESERRELALAMLEDVLRALSAVPDIGTIAVVSPDEEVLHAAAALSAMPILEPPSIGGLNQAISYATDQLSPTPSTLLIVLADVPGITPGAITTLLDAIPELGVAACPSDDGGTSALAVRPARVVLFRFGPQSFDAHQEAASIAGVDFRSVHIPELALDIDSPADLRALLEQPAETSTHRLLARLGIAARVA